MELVNQFYRNTGNGDEDKLEIEKALDAAFAMVTVWT